MKDKKSIFSRKSVLVTGGTGSFGQAFVKNLILNEDIEKIIILSRDEWKQWRMQQDPIFQHKKIRYFLGDVRDKERLIRAFQDVDFVVHAAALKQVPAAEYNPSEFIKTNILGAMNIVDAAIATGVKKVIGLSTDKAVNPVNLYGASKLCSDKLITAASAYVGKRGSPLLSIVRYGNVLGSRGSLLPYWQEQLDRKEKLTLTDKEMTRFWITLDETVLFVKTAFSAMQGGEIFVPKVPSMKILDLLKAFAPNTPYTISGIRPGEKINEVLISSDDARHTYEFPSHYTIAPFFAAFDQSRYTIKEKTLKGKKVPKNFILASNVNPLFTESVPEIKKLLSKV